MRFLACDPTLEDILFLASILHDPVYYGKRLLLYEHTQGQASKISICTTFCNSPRLSLAWSATQRPTNGFLLQRSGLSNNKILYLFCWSYWPKVGVSTRSGRGTSNFFLRSLLSPYFHPPATKKLSTPLIYLDRFQQYFTGLYTFY